MLDISALIKGILEAEWGIINPPKEGFAWMFDEFDPKWGGTKTTFQNPVEKLVNGGFEMGNFSGWETMGSGQVINTDKHSGVYCAEYGPYPGFQLMQQVGGIIKEDIMSFGVWHKELDAEGKTSVLIEYMDNYSTSFFLPYSASWAYKDLLPYIQASRPIRRVGFSHYGYLTVRIDDASLIYCHGTSFMAQVLFENYPDKKTYIAQVSNGTVYKVEHSCKITIYLRPVRYDDTSIENSKTILFNIKSEIDRILAKKKFSVTGIANLEMTLSGWNDKGTIARGRGVKTRKEPIVFQSEKLVHGVYYIIG